MAWNDDGPGSQGPWGQGGGNRPQQPPDVEEMIRAAKERFGKNMPGGGKSWKLLIMVAAIFWMATGVYVIAPDEQGVVLRFGKHVDTTDPGPHFHLPYPIEKVLKPRVTQIRRIEVGFRTRGRNSVDIPAESLMLTGDENIVDIDLSVQYRIKDGADYLFNVRNPRQDPHAVVRSAAEASIRRVVARNSIDEALTIGKESIQSQTKVNMQALLDSYNSGLSIVAVQLQQVAPPQEVVHAFKDVASAREDKERSVNEAQGYFNDIIPKAKGEAAQVVKEAEGYKIAKVSRASGDAKRFTALYNEYKKAKNVTSQRLYLETMEVVYADMKKVIVDAKSGVLPYLPLDQGRVRGEKR